LIWGPWLLGDVAVPVLRLDDGVEAPGFTVCRRQLGVMLAVGAALADDDVGPLVPVLARYLDASERATLAGALVDAAEDDGEAEALAEVVLTRAGHPLPPLKRLADEAADWAAFASPAEVKHYALAAFRGLRPADRAGFLRAAQRVVLG